MGNIFERDLLRHKDAIVAVIAQQARELAAANATVTRLTLELDALTMGQYSEWQQRAERAESARDALAEKLRAAEAIIAAADAYCAALDAANLTHNNVYGDLASDCPICQCRDAYDAARAKAAP